MLHWIVMNVIGMPRKILFVAHRVFPEAALPKRVLAPAIAAHRRIGPHDLPGEEALDPPPACRKVGVSVRQSEDAICDQNPRPEERSGMTSRITLALHPGYARSPGLRFARLLH